MKHKVDGIVTVWNCEAALNDDPKKFWLDRDFTPDISDTSACSAPPVLFIGFYYMIISIEICKLKQL